VPKDGPPEAGQHFVKAGRVALKPVESNTIILKSPREIAIMREAGKVVARTRRILQETTEPGMTTADLDRIAENEFKQGGAVSTAKGYYGFPGHICVSVNQQVVHGIPGPRKIKQGDVVKVDIAAKRNGYVADTATSFIVGEGTEEAQRLLTVTYAGKPWRTRSTGTRGSVDGRDTGRTALSALRAHHSHYRSRA
jgi:hypothetical protein